MPAETGFDLDEIERRASSLVFRLRGRGVSRLKASEPGGHRFQRVPPTEKRGRVHTSTVTVAVFDDVVVRGDIGIDRKDIRVDTYKGSGAGGQHRNKTESCVRCVHVPTGIEAKSESERSQHINLELALALLTARVKATKLAALQSAHDDDRRRQVGSGQRGDKVRTIREQDGVVTCERTGRRARLTAYQRGELEWLWP